jgi:hypothetical protein
VINGDYIDATATWSAPDGGAATLVEDVGPLAGRPVRLKFSMRGTKLYAFQFAQTGTR